MVPLPLAYKHDRHTESDWKWCIAPPNVSIINCPPLIVDGDWRTRTCEHWRTCYPSTLPGNRLIMTVSDSTSLLLLCYLCFATHFVSFASSQGLKCQLASKCGVCFSLECVHVFSLVIVLLVTLCVRPCVKMARWYMTAYRECI